MDKGIDIIVPIYNAYDDLQICLDSIYKHTDLNKNRLILINDNSSDERMRYYLDNQQRENVVVIHNESNKGFSNNINIGMAQSEENDVILLNSDTIVTKNWVEKMVACAYSDDSIGTVTPLSNNATLCSVPNFCEENVLPEGMSIDKAAEIVEECSLRKYPRITVAHGFCMFVKREVINTIGNFDAETFGRGYGEENDFCNRAEQMGYIHVMCDDTYIYHSGTKSFVSKEKEEYIKEHERILYKRYPFQMQKNAEYCRDNPNYWVGKNIGMYFELWNGKKNIFYLLQSDFREDADDNVGGTQLHVKHLTYGLRNSMNIFVAARNGEYLQVTAYTSDKEFFFKFYIGEREAFPVIRNRKLAEIFKSVLIGFKINLVHVHHTATTSLDIFFEADKLGIPILFTMHDYYYICPNITMLDQNGNICIYNDNLNCQKCLKSKKGLYENNHYLSMWRMNNKRALDKCSCIIVPSESAKEVFLRYYSLQKEKLQVIEHGVDEPYLLNVDETCILKSSDMDYKIEKISKNGNCIFLVGIVYFKDKSENKYKVILKVKDRAGKTVYMPTNYGNHPNVIVNANRFYVTIPNNMFQDGDLSVMPILVKGNKYYKKNGKETVIKGITFQRNNRFNIAFVGGINEEKGGKIVSRIIRECSEDVNWYIFGGIGDEQLYNLKKDNLVKTGYYYPEDIASYLKYYNIDMICILSKCPETYSYTLSEAIVNDIPIIVTDVGALGQRAHDNGYKAIVCLEEKKAVEEVLYYIHVWKNKGKEYFDIKEQLKSFKCKNMKQMLAEYKQLYQNYFKKYLPERQPAAFRQREMLLRSYTELGTGRDDKENQKLIEKMKMMENQIQWINENVTIQFMLKLTKISFPFKQKLRKILLRVLNKNVFNNK